MVTHEWQGSGKKTLSLKSATHTLQWWNGYTLPKEDLKNI